MEEFKKQYELREMILDQVSAIFENIYSVIGQPKENETVVEQAMAEEFVLALLNRIEDKGYSYVKYNCEHCEGH